MFSAKWSPKLGLDLAGGLSVVYQTAKSVPQSELQETVNILNNRVNGLGVSGAQVSTTGNNEISVSIPGVKDAATVLADIGNTAQLYFRPVLCTAYPLTLTKATKATKTTKAQPAQKAISGNGTLPACGASYATNLGQSRRHAQQLGAGVLVQQHPARPGVRAVHQHQHQRAQLRAPAPSSSRACPGTAPP